MAVHFRFDQRIHFLKLPPIDQMSSNQTGLKGGHHVASVKAKSDWSRGACSMPLRSHNTGLRENQLRENL